jgi:hypothetical protein
MVEPEFGLPAPRLPYSPAGPFGIDEAAGDSPLEALTMTYVARSLYPSRALCRLLGTGVLLAGMTLTSPAAFAAPPGATPMPADPAAATPAPDAAAPAPAPDAAAPAPGTPAPDAAAPAPATPAPDAATPPATEPTAPAPGDAAAPPATAPAATADPNQPLKQNIANLVHYVLIARYELANAELTQLNARPDAPEVISALRDELRQRNLDLDAWVLRIQEVDPLKQSAAALATKLNKIRGIVSHDPKFIEEQIKLLAGSERQFEFGVARLRQTGELAVPMMIDYLRDSSQSQYHGGIRRALVQLNRVVLNPLVAATEMKDTRTLAAIADVLGDMRVADTAPYLLRALEDKNLPGPTRAEVMSALQRIPGGSDGRSAGDAFFDLATRFYYGSSAIKPDSRNPVAYVWSWDEGKGLMHKDVPQAPGEDPRASVFNDVMAMRSAEDALRHSTKQDAVSLWLAANNKREVDLKGQSDPIYADASAHYWNVNAGTSHLNAVLTRALKDGNSAVALKAVKSLNDIIGRSTLAESPLIAAMRYAGDKLVRYEAAMAVASALPQRPFEGRERVVLLLAEAIAQTGQPSVLVLAPTPEAVKQISGGLTGFQTAGGTTADQVIAESAKLPSIDVVVIQEPDDKFYSQVRAFYDRIPGNARLERAARLVIIKSPASAWTRQVSLDQMLSTVVAGGDLPKAIEAARLKAAGAPVDPAVAVQYSLRAANLLQKLATAEGRVFDLTAAEPTLLGSLTDKRPENVKAVAGVLGTMNSNNAQMALLDKAVMDATANDVKAAEYKAVANSAKLYGNRLDQQRIEALRKAVKAEKDPEVRAAAGEALGALNLPAQQIGNMILQRSMPAAAPAGAAAMR